MKRVCSISLISKDLFRDSFSLSSLSHFFDFSSSSSLLNLTISSLATSIFSCALNSETSFCDVTVLSSRCLRSSSAQFWASIFAFTSLLLASLRAMSLSLKSPITHLNFCISSWWIRCKSSLCCNFSSDSCNLCLSSSASAVSNCLSCNNVFCSASSSWVRNFAVTVSSSYFTCSSNSCFSRISMRSSFSSRFCNCLSSTCCWFFKASSLFLSSHSFSASFRSRSSLSFSAAFMSSTSCL